jgi:hypothetical protein
MIPLRLLQRFGDREERSVNCKTYLFDMPIAESDQSIFDRDKRSAYSMLCLLNP